MRKFANVKTIMKRPAASTKKAAAMKKPAAAVAACPLAECRELGIDPADMPVTDDDELEALLQAAADAVLPPPGAAECLELANGLDPAEMPVTDDDELEALLQAAADAVPPPVADVAVPPGALLPAAAEPPPADDAAAPPPAFPYVDLVRVLEAADPGAVVAAAAAAAVIPPPVPAPPSPFIDQLRRARRTGCKKCRGQRTVCVQCKQWAATGNKGFRKSGAVVLSGDTYW